MGRSTKRIWFKAIAVMIIQCFLLGQSAFALNTDDKYQKQKRLMNQEQTRAAHVQEDQEAVTTGYSELATQGHSNPSSSNNSQSELNAVVEALAGQPADLKAGTLKAMGCSIGKAAAALIGSGMSAKETSKALVDAGYDKAKVSEYLANVIDKTETQTGTQSGTAEQTTAKISVQAQAVTASAQQTAVKQDNVNTPVAATAAEPAEENSQAGQKVSQPDYTALKQQGVSATEVLKSAAEQGLDMSNVAAQMKEAGYSNKEIADAFISKAMNWTQNATVEIVNCAAQSLAEMLSGQGNIVSTVELAYEVIVSDIMQSGKVNIQDGQIMSSMSAIKDIASEHGVQLQGVNAAMSDLENMSGAGIVHLDNNHWVTVKDVKADSVTVMDNGKEVTMSKAEFQSRWDGNLLTQDKNKGQILNAQQMLNILGADIGDADGNSHGAGTEGGHDGSGDMGGGSDRGGGEGGSDRGGWGGFCDSVSTGFGKAVDAVCGAVSGAFGKACDAVADFGNTVSGWGQSLSGWGKDQGGLIGGLAQAAGGVLGAVGKGISGLGNMGTAAVDGFNNMSTAGKVATVVGACFGVPCAGVLVDMAVNTYNGMKAGNSFSGSLSNAFDNSLAGKAVDAMLDNPVANGLKDLGNMALDMGNSIQEKGKAMVEEGKKKDGIAGALQQGLGYAVQAAGFVADVAVHGVSVTGKAMAGAAKGIATAPIDVVSGVLDIGSGLVNQDMGKVKSGLKDVTVGGLKIGAAYVGSQIATGIATNIATEMAMTGAVPGSAIALGGGVVGIAGLVDSQTDGKLGDVAMGNFDALGTSDPANVSVDNTLAGIDTNGSENELLFRPLAPAF